MISESVCIENLKTCFESKDLDRGNFSISAVQKACTVSFYEARDTIVYGLNKGILFASYEDDVFPPIKGLRFSDEPKGCDLGKLFAEGRKLGVSVVFAGSDPDSFARNIDKSLPQGSNN